ncbi:MAG: hypothetical protein IJ424_08785 [Oscillospiraceae bacterium]|nr:hypothetical protein [Oscillospiraceae bacterium]
MIKITDTFSLVKNLYNSGTFNLERWKEYADGIHFGLADMLLSDMNEYIATGKYTFEKDFLPIINNVCTNNKLGTLHDSFVKVTDNLNQKVVCRFGKELDVHIILYLGLCNAAGWVTSLSGRVTVLLGVEKILELNWQDINSMRGLIYHELGHVYQMQHGILERESSDSRSNFVWQLFTEGVAMYFEQALVGDLNYYHQDINGWNDWCREHLPQIKRDFNSDLDSMTQFNQRYFGDWCDYCGKGDVGYYLGAEFVHHLLKTHSFDDMINYDIEKVYELYCEFTAL